MRCKAHVVAKPSTRKSIQKRQIQQDATGRISWAFQGLLESLKIQDPFYSIKQ
uniref:Uncharacterized protein n=1 Tax=Rhizophora mucronata TaxID=61149 RepID=A0A2P2P5M8_RHIMU